MTRWRKNPATRARSGSSVTMVPSSSGRSSLVSPASWAMIITAVRAAVATRPNSAQPAQSMSARRQLARLGLEGLQDVDERLVEAGHPLVLEGAADGVHVHPDRGQPVHHHAGGAGTAVDGAGEGAVVLEGGNGRLGQGVDRVGPDEAVDIEGVRIGGVLGRG